MNPRHFLPIVLLLIPLSACAPKTDVTQVNNTAQTVTAFCGHRIEGAELREGLPGVEDGVLYLTLTNTSETEVRLLGGHTPIAREIVPMRDHSAGGAFDSTLAPGEQRVFQPGSDHLMLLT